MSAGKIDVNFIQMLANAHDQTWMQLDTTHTSKGLDDSDAVLIRTYFSESSEQQNPVARQTIEGKLLLHGWGGIKDVVQAVEKLMPAADSGFASAQFNLGHCFYFGNGSVQDKAKAFHYYKLAAESHYLPAIFKLAECYYYGEGVETNRDEVSRLYEKIEDLGDEEIHFELAQAYQKGHYEAGIVVEKDEKKAVALYLKAAIKGHADAQYHYALCLLEGIGADVNFDEAIHYFKCAIKQNHSQALVSLGGIYLDRRYRKYLKPNVDEALNCFVQAAALNNAEACDWIASYYDGLQANSGESKKLACYYYFKSFVLSGLTSAYRRLEELLDGASLVDEDCAQGYASNQEPNPHAQAYLVLIHSLGIHLAPDPEKAETLYNSQSAVVLQQILINHMDDLTGYDKTMIHLASMIVKRVSGFLNWGWIPKHIQDKLFSDLLHRTVAGVLTNVDNYQAELTLLKNMSEQGILNASERLSELADNKTKRLSKLMMSSCRDLRGPHKELIEQVKDGSEKAKEALDDFNRKMAFDLSEQALNKDKDALKNLISMAQRVAVAMTVLGQYYLSCLQKKDSQKHRFFSNLKGNKQSKESLAKSAFDCFDTAKSGDMRAYYHLGHCYFKGLGTKENKLLAVYYFFNAGLNGSSKEALLSLAEGMNSSDPHVVIASIIFQGILLEKAPHFYKNKLLEQAFEKDREISINVFLHILDGQFLSEEKNIYLLSWLLSRKLEKDDKLKIKELLKSLIVEKIDKMISAFESKKYLYSGTGYMEWIKYTDTSTFISSVLLIENDRNDNNIFERRLLLLLLAKKKAESKKLDVKAIEKCLSSYKLARNDVYEQYSRVVNEDFASRERASSKPERPKIKPNLNPKPKSNPNLKAKPDPKSKPHSKAKPKAKPNHAGEVRTNTL